jgi:hypothetical protein
MKDVSLIEVYQQTETWPSSLETAQEIAEHLKNSISADQLLKWAQFGVCPHYRINGGIPFFRLAEVKKWMLRAQILEQCEGTFEPYSVTLMVIGDRPNVVNVSDLPKELCTMGRVFDLDACTAPSGVYFLYSEGVLQYIGQSNNPIARVATHLANGKTFDQVFMIPVPVFMLLDRMFYR